MRVYFDERRLLSFVRRCRERWRDFEVEKVVTKRRKQILYVRVQGFKVKLIVYGDGRLRAYGRAEGLAYAVKKIAERVLGLDKRA